MKEIIKSIIEKYYRSNGEYYSRWYYNEEDEEFQMDKEIKIAFENEPYAAFFIDQYSVEVLECYRSCGYDCDMLVVAWTEGGRLETYNLLLESM